MTLASIIEYRAVYGEKYKTDRSGMVPIGTNGDLFMCLDYRNNADAPEVWEL